MTDTLKYIMTKELTDATARIAELEAKLARAQKAVRNSWRGSARKEWKEEHAVAIVEAFEAAP